MRVSVYALFLFLSVGLLTTSCTKVFHLADVDATKYRVNEETISNENQEISNIIAPYKEQLDAKMDEVINILDVDLEKNKPESTMSNWMTDIVHDHIQKHFDKPLAATFQNYGGLRVNSIAKGELTVREIYELMPFENEVLIVEAKGSEVRTFFKKIAESRGWPVSRQVKLHITKEGKIDSLMINGEPVIENQIYYLAIPDYVANGGDGNDFLVKLPRTSTGIKVRDAIIEECKYRKSQGINETAKLDQRITRE